METKKIDSLPDLPGIYIIKNRAQEIIYIGKATSILKRVKEHFSSGLKTPKEESIISEAQEIDYIITSSEPEALLLESYLIKEKKPRYNINFKDDKSYPCIKFTLKEEYPSVSITRKKTEDGSLYLGPYPNVKKLKQTLKVLRGIFPFRSCKKLPKLACLYFHLNLCPAPCVENIDKYEYRKNIIGLIKSLLGNLDEVLKDLTLEMDKYVERREFEKAALIRDKIKALGKVSIVFGVDASINTLENIREKLKLPALPRIIDAVDISNISGRLASGSVVRFKDGKPFKEFYRKFRLKKQDFINDYQMMVEVVLRRYQDLMESKADLPDLIMLDGGKGHLNVVDGALRAKLNLDLPLVAYAKGKDIIFSKYKKSEVKFAPDSSEKHLLVKIREEAHRFALGYHKLLRKKGMKQSVFEEVKGIGKGKLKLILSQVEDLSNLQKLTPSELKKVKGIGDVLAERIYKYLRKKRNK